MAKATEYEVRCPRCNVTFPVGTKRCLHCGGGTGPSRSASTRATWDDQAGRFVVRDDVEDVSGRRPILQPRPFDAEPEEMEEGGRGGLLRAGITLVWILLAVGFSLMRACSEQ
jgi:hypothetical protein